MTIFSASSDLPRVQSSHITSRSLSIMRPVQASSAIGKVVCRKMKCAVIVIAILATVDSLSLKNATTTSSPQKNETTVMKDRSNRDSKRYIDSYHDKGLSDYYGDYNGYKQRPNRLKGRRRQKPKTTTPQYDYDDFEGFSKTEPKKDYSSGYEQYFKHPYIGNVGKIFNQDDINDFYLKENNDYSKLVKEVSMELPFKSSQKLNVGNTDPYKDIDKYKTLMNFDKKDAKLPTPISTTSWGNVKNLDIKNSYNKDPWNSESTKPSFSSYFSQQFDNNKNNDFGKTYAQSFDTKPKEYDFGKTYGQNYDTKTKEYDFGTTYNFDTKTKEFNFGKPHNHNFDTKNKEYDFKGYSQSVDTKNKEYDFGKAYSQLLGTKNKEYDFGKTYTTTQSPLKNYEAHYPEKSYASSYNFDTKPFAEIQPTKYTIPPYTFGKLKSADYVSEFDMRGNPISPYSSADLFSEVSKDMYHLNKYNTPDFTKSFYDFNKQPETSTKSYFNYKPASDNGYDSSNYNNWGYAASYNYGGQGVADFSSSHGSQNYADYSNKDLRFTAANAISSGGHGSHPILVPVPQPYPVKVPVAKPVAVPILKEIKIPIEKLVPYPVFKNVPYPVEKHIPVPVEKQVPVAVPHPYPVKIPIIKNIYHHSRDEEFDHNHSHDHGHSHDHKHSHDHHHNHQDYEPKRPRQRGRGEDHKRPHHRRVRGRHNSGYRN